MRIICNECNGNGVIRISDYIPDTTAVVYREVTCEKCNGEGWIEAVFTFTSDCTSTMKDA